MKKVKNLFFYILNKNWFWAAMSGTIASVVYILTLAPTVYLDDAGDFLSAAATWGIPHPSGYPLWVLLGNIFKWLPVGDIAWRINLMTALISALTISFLVLLIIKIWQLINKKEPKIYLKIIASVSSLIVAFSNTYWSESNSAEVYGLNGLLIIGLIYIFLFWYEKRQDKYLLWGSFVFGLSLTNHQMMILTAPAFVLFIFLTDKQLVKNWPLLIKSFLLIIVGLLVYLYLPIASHFNPPVDWGNPENWHNFWKHVLRQQYGDLAPFKLMADKLKFLKAFFSLLATNFYWPTLFLMLGGLIFLFRKNSKIACLLFLVFLSNNIFIYLLRGARYGTMNDYYADTYYVPSLLIATICLALCLTTLIEWLANIFSNKKLILLLRNFILLVIILIPITLLYNNWVNNDKSGFWLSYDYAKSMLQDLEPQAILVYEGYETIADDTEFMGLLFMQAVEKFRLDVVIMTSLDIFPHSQLKLDKNYFTLVNIERRKILLSEGIKKAVQERRPLYTSFVVNQSMTNGEVVSRSVGNVYKIFSNLKEAKAYSFPANPPSLRNLKDFNLNDISITDLVARYSYRLAAYYTDQGDKKQAQKNLQQAFDMGATQTSYYFRDFVEHQIEWQ